MMWEIDQEEEELFNQYEGIFNLHIAQKEEDEDEEWRIRDDEARMARDSHSRRVIQAVAKICRPTRSRNLDRSRQQRGEELLDDYFWFWFWHHTKLVLELATQWGRRNNYNQSR
ncbi:hypothetical protein TB2_000508 [Malus domestica]